MPDRNRKPSEERPPDVEIGAGARADELRFSKRPDTRVEFTGRSVAESDSGSVRENLPDEVEPGVTYRDISIGWRAAAWVEEPDLEGEHRPDDSGDQTERR